MKLLAKSEPPITLLEHIEDCLRIWNRLKISFPQVKEILGEFDFWEIVKLAVITHDLGKSHIEFIKLLDKKAHKWEGQRHELFSLPFIDGLNVVAETKQLLKLIVAGHHKDLETLNERISSTYSSGIVSEFGDDGFMNYEDEFNKLRLAEVSSLLQEHFQIFLSEYKAVSPGKFVRSYLRKADAGGYIVSSPDYFKLLLLFGALKHCDHLGSAQVKHIEQIVPSCFSFIEKQQIELHEKGFDFYAHQLESRQATGNVILTAPTGSGKTESAMLWLERQVQEYGQGRAFYVLPFTASINAMYERLSSNEKGLGTEKVGMLHGKLQDYLYEYLDELQYESSTKKEEISKIKDKFKTIYTPLKVVTPFQLLKHLFGLKGFEQGMFEWVGGYFIFDEIHAYNPEVFAQIKVFLEYVVKYLKGKIFIMTATMPTFLRRELEQAVGTFTAISADEALYNRFNRHHVIVKDGLLSENRHLIEADLKEGKKVLVVCNTVIQAQETFKHLSPFATNSILLHSAFTGEDRNIHEKLLKEGENDEENPIQLLVGTQAIEVSLDIDYDLIYTEPAPIDALIQRFGRVNRKRKKGICPVIIFRSSHKNDKFIYNPNLVLKTIEVFDEIASNEKGIIKEQRLQEYIDIVYPQWDAKSNKLFSEMYQALKYTSENQLIPLLHSKKQEEDFYKQFDGIKVLPIKLKERFENYLASYDFIGAERLKVQIGKNKFAQLMFERDDNLYKTSYNFESGNKKLISVPYWVLTKKYDKELGLIYDEQEVWEAEIFA
jgi:CRISPR-associated endonuclease/helicase Cas3